MKEQKIYLMHHKMPLLIFSGNLARLLNVKISMYKSLFFLSFLLIALLFNFTIKEREESFAIKGTIYITSEHCGGAKPSDGLLETLKTPRPCEDKTIYVRRGTHNSTSLPVIAEAVSDSKGEFKLNLPVGTYCIVGEEKKDDVYFNQMVESYSKKTNYYTAINIGCLKKWLRTPDVVFKVVGKKNQSVSFTYHQECPWYIPCAIYHGPGIPSANPVNTDQPSY
jgi:hypothetical protein